MEQIIVGLTNDIATVLLKYNTVANLDTVLEFIRTSLAAIAGVLVSVTPV